MLAAPVDRDSLPATAPAAVAAPVPRRRHFRKIQLLGHGNVAKVYLVHTTRDLPQHKFNDVRISI